MMQLSLSMNPVVGIGQITTRQEMHDVMRVISAQFYKAVDESFDLGSLPLSSLAFSSRMRFSSSAAGSSLGSGSASSPRNALARIDCSIFSTRCMAFLYLVSRESARAKSFSTRRTISCCSSSEGSVRISTMYPVV